MDTAAPDAHAISVLTAATVCDVVVEAGSLIVPGTYAMPTKTTQSDSGLGIFTRNATAIAHQADKSKWPAVNVRVGGQSVPVAVSSTSSGSPAPPTGKIGLAVVAPASATLVVKTARLFESNTAFHVIVQLRDPSGRTQINTGDIRQVTIELKSDQFEHVVQVVCDEAIALFLRSCNQFFCFSLSLPRISV